MMQFIKDSIAAGFLPQLIILFAAALFFPIYTIIMAAIRRRTAGREKLPKRIKKRIIKSCIEELYKPPIMHPDCTCEIKPFNINQGNTRPGPQPLKGKTYKTCEGLTNPYFMPYEPPDILGLSKIYGPRSDRLPHNPIIAIDKATGGPIDMKAWQEYNWIDASTFEDITRGTRTYIRGSRIAEGPE